MFYTGMKVTTIATFALAAVFVIHHIRCIDQRNFLARNRRSSQSSAPKE